MNNSLSSLARTLILGLTVGLGASQGAMAADIRWNNDAYEQTISIAPGQTAEACGSIEPRMPVDWRFAASGPLTFDIHRHSGADVVYAMRSYLTREQNGKFSPTFQFDWCWAWTNETSEPVTVRVELRR